MFSRATLIESFTLFAEMNSHTTLDTFALKYGLENFATGSNLETKAVNIAKYIISNPNEPGLLNNNIALEIMEEVIKKATSNTYHYESSTKEFRKHPMLRRLLLKDGFDIVDGELIKTFETEIDFTSNETLLTKLLNKYQLDVAKGHYEQASASFNKGLYSACNSQLRSYTEELLDRLAEKLTGTTYADHHSAKIAISKVTPPIFYKNLNEWLDNGQGFFEAFWKRLHPAGSHPGLADEYDSVFRINLVQVTTLEILRRFDEHYGS